MRPFAFAVVAAVLAAPAVAADGSAPNSAPNSAPERLLPPTTQLYVRWDGIAAHGAAYKASVWGGLMAGPTGESVRTLLARGQKLLGSSALAEPLADGGSLAELRANLADLKALDKVAELIADRGLIVAAEARMPTPTIRGIGRTVGAAVGGKLPGPDVLAPHVRAIVVVPEVGDRADVLFGTLRLAFKTTESNLGPFEAAGRKGFCLTPTGSDSGVGQMAWWMEGNHFVFYMGPGKPADVVAEMAAHAATGGLTGHPLFRRCSKTGDFETVARGFVDTDKVVALAKALAGPFVPGLKERLDSTGLGGLKAVVFASGFDGKESRAVYEFDVPGDRKGVAKALKNVPLGLADLPPMPPDVSRFSALRLDPAATYAAGLGLVEFLALSDEFGVEDGAGKTNAAAVVKARREYLAREADKFLSISVADDLLPHLGDKLVVFQSPTEGLQVFGTVVCVSVKDAAKVKSALGRIHRGLEAGAKVKMRRGALKGVEYREFYARGFGLVTPTYAIVGDWLILASHPQAVQGVILRSKGDLEKWAPDAATAKRLAKVPADGCGLQYCDPRGTAANLCTIGSLFASYLNIDAGGSDDEDFDPLPTSVVPNAHELGKHLFPNLTVTRDDGKTIRVAVSESFSLPLEFIGVEPLGVLAYLGLGFFL
jgi:hypothetical protein